MTPDDLQEPDDLRGHLTPMRRFLERVKGPLGVVLAVLLVIPLGAGLLQWLVFDRAGDRVVDQLADADQLDVELVRSVLLVAASPCTGAGSTSGTAFALDVDGEPRLVTNRHVVEEVGVVGLRELGGGPGPRVTSWRLSSHADVAELILEDPAAMPPALAMAAGGADVGDPVRTVGFPAGLPYTTEGPVARLAGNLAWLDMQVAPGASGSPVLDASGAVVAQVFGRTTDGRGVATRAGTVRAALDALGASRSGC